MYILFDFFASAWGVIRSFILFIDSVGLTFIDNAYSLLVSAAAGFEGDVVKEIAENIAKNVYIIIGIFALFRIAVILINTIINPDKLTDKESGFGNVLSRFVITICLFIAVPLIFDMSREIQAEIMNNNYISKAIIGTDLTSGNPGQVLKDTAVRALIHPDKRVANKNSDNKYTCINNNDPCKTAVESWNNDAGITTLTRFIGDYEEVDGENVYIYDYIPFVTLLVGGFMTYVLFSFAIDIAVRSVELLALEVLAPLFIVTYIDPKSSSNGPFKNWVKTCSKTFISLFIKIGIVCLMLLFMQNLSTLMGSMNSDNGAFLNLLMMIAILIFAKKAPKWIGDMIGVEGGLGGLGIGKKLGGAALVGGALTKAGHAATGMGLTALRTARAARIANKQNLKSKGLDKNSRFKAGYHNSDSDKLGRKIGSGLKSYFNPSQNLRNIGSAINSGARGVVKGIPTGVVSGWNASDMKDVRAKAKVNADAQLNKFAPGYENLSTRAQNWFGRKTDKLMEKKLGDPFKIEERQKEAEGIAKANDRYDKVEYTTDPKTGDKVRDKKLQPVKSQEAIKMVDELNEAHERDGYKFDATSPGSLSGALIQARIDAGKIKLPDGLRLSTDGTSIVNSSGEKVQSSSKYCRENRIYNPYGEKEIEVMAKENAYTKAANYASNGDKIMDANKAATMATSQILELTGNIRSTMGDDVADAFSRLESCLSTIKSLDRQIIAAERDGNEELVRSLKEQRQDELDVAEAYKTSEHSILNGINPDIIKSLEAAVSTRSESLSTAEILTKTNQEIRSTIIENIEVNGDDSPYHVVDVTTGEAFNLFDDPTKVDYAITLMDKSRSKAKEDADKLKPKKASESDK